MVKVPKTLNVVVVSAFAIPIISVIARMVGRRNISEQRIAARISVFIVISKVWDRSRRLLPVQTHRCGEPTSPQTSVERIVGKARVGQAQILYAPTRANWKRLLRACRK